MRVLGLGVRSEVRLGLDVYIIMYFLSTNPGYRVLGNLAVNYYLPIIYGNPLKYINQFLSSRSVGLHLYNHHPINLK